MLAELIAPLAVSDVIFVGVSFSVVAALCSAGQTILIRRGTVDGSATDALAVVLATNVVILTVGATFLYAPNFRLTRISVLTFALGGLVGTLAGRLLYFTSIERIGASRANPIRASQPLHSTVIAVVILHETLSGAHLLGIILITLGVAAISWETSRLSATTTNADSLVDLLLPLAAAFFFGIDPILAKIGFAEGTPVAVGLAVKVVAATTGFFVYLAWRNELPPPRRLKTFATRWYLGAAVFNTLFLVSMFSALEVAPVVVVIPIIQISPLIVLVISSAYLPHLEEVTWRLVVASCVVVIGAVFVTLFS